MSSASFTPPSDVDADQMIGNILVVDDNEINQMIAQHYLSRLGYQSDCVDNGEKAVARLKEAEYDAVLMDIQMPVLDGYSATRQIREQLGLNVPIIGVTASSTPRDRQRCLNAGMDDYLTKPVDIDALAMALAKRGISFPRS